MSELVCLDVYVDGERKERGSFFEELQRQGAGLWRPVRRNSDQHTMILGRDDDSVRAAFRAVKRCCDKQGVVIESGLRENEGIVSMTGSTPREPNMEPKLKVSVYAQRF